MEKRELTLTEGVAVIDPPPGDSVVKGKMEGLAVIDSLSELDAVKLELTLTE